MLERESMQSLFPHAFFSCETDTYVLLPKMYIMLVHYLILMKISFVWNPQVVKCGIFHFCLYCEFKSSLLILYGISCISAILHRNIFKSGLSVCWTNCQDSMISVAPFLIDPPGQCSIATWDCGILWRMNASHSKMFPFFYTAFLLKLLWQMKHVVSCRSSKEFPKYFLG
jgi:hypothetical protein